MRRVAYTLLAVAVSGSLVLRAQELGAVLEGRALSRNGGVLEGAVVTVKGGAVTLAARTDEDGRYRFPRAPTGVLDVEVECPGFRPLALRRSLPIGRELVLDVVLDVAAVSEQVDVVDQGAREAWRDAGTAGGLRADEIALVSGGREATELIGRLPGAQEERKAGGIAIAGGSGSENRFLVDGIDTTHPQTGISGKPMPAIFVGELQVKTGGFEAEHGGATGGVVHLVTRSGGDQLFALAALEAASNAFDGQSRPSLELSPDGHTAIYRRYRRDDVTSLDPTLLASGPLRRGTAWFSLAGRRSQRDTERTIEFVDSPRASFPQRERTDYLTATLSSTVRTSLFLRLSTSLAPHRLERSLPGQDGRGSAARDDYRFGTKGENASTSASLDWVVDPRWVASVRVGRFELDSETTKAQLEPFVTLFGAGTPGSFDEVPDELVRPSGYSSGPRYTVTRRDRYLRTAIATDVEARLDWRGEHHLKLGARLERLANDVHRAGNASLHFFGWDERDPFFGARGRYGYMWLENGGTFGSVERAWRCSCRTPGHRSPV